MRGRRLGQLAMAMGFAFVGLAPQADAQERRVALVVGNGAYRFVPALANSGNDARLIARTLQDVGFTLVGGAPLLDADKTHFDAALQAFGRQVAGANVAVFYYAGHGLQVQGTNWLVPVSANPTRPQDLDFQMVDAGLVLRQLQGAGTQLNVMILDACRNNPFGGRGLRGGESGLAQMRAPEGTLIAYATEPGTVASDGFGPNSPYTAALAEQIRRPGLDVLRMFNQVALAVKRATGGAQLPWLSSSPIEGDFAFTPAAATVPLRLPPAPAPAPVPAPAMALPSPAPMPPPAMTLPSPAPRPAPAMALPSPSPLPAPAMTLPPVSPPVVPASLPNPAPIPVPPGMARRCVVTGPIMFSDFIGTERKMTVSNEGGACKAPFSRQGVPYESGYVVNAPRHGTVEITKGDRATSVVYRPTPGYVGPDQFGVRLSPGNGYYSFEATMEPPPDTTVQPPVPAAAPMPVPPGTARHCVVTGPTMFSYFVGTDRKMTVSNEGQACDSYYGTSRGGSGVRLPFDSGYLVDAPKHGTVEISSGQTTTAVIYRPTPGYVGPDQFGVRLSPGNAYYGVEVTVQP